MLNLLPAGPYWLIVRADSEEPVMVCDTYTEACDALEALDR